MSMRQAQLIAAASSIFIGCLFVLYSIPIYENRIGGGGGPGAGGFPFWVGLITTFWGGAYLRQAWKNQDHGEFIIRDRRQRAVLLQTASSLVVYLAVMPYLGFVFSSLLLLMYYLKFIGGYRLRFALPFALAVTASISYCFQVLLYISLPRGLMGW